LNASLNRSTATSVSSIMLPARDARSCRVCTPTLGEPRALVVAVAQTEVRRTRGLADAHLVVFVRVEQAPRAFGSADLEGRVEQYPCERRAVIRQVVLTCQRPVHELVQHDALGAIAARQRDRWAAGILAVEGLARAVPGAKARDRVEPARR